VPTERIETLLEFFRGFADWCHHTKEEGVLFPALEQVNIHREGGPLGVMLFEHKEARALLHRMADAVPHIHDNRGAHTQFVQAAHSYVQLLRDHIVKEDNVLFRMAETLLADQDAKLIEACERHEQEVMGAGVHDRFHRLIDELEHEFLGDKTPHAHACVTA
jgi:hemerythrin-like domain-containing protein